MTFHKQRQAVVLIVGGIAALCLCASVDVAHADDWPQWRGPQRDGVWRGNGVVRSLPATGLKVRWRVRVGRGYAGPAVANGRVYVTDLVLNPERERVLCFDEATGKRVWTHAYPTDYAQMEYGNGPRATPTVHDGRVYTLGTQGDLCCLDAQTGKAVWQIDLAAEYDARIPRYGASAAPIIEDDLVIVCVGGRDAASVVAFDRHTGRQRWAALNDEPAYSAPVVVTAGGRRQLIVWTADGIVSLNPATGDVYWQEKWKTSFDAAQVIASPVLHGDKLLFVMGWNRGARVVQLHADKSSAETVWRTRAGASTMLGTPVVIGDHFYTVSTGGQLGCYTMADGELVWQVDDAQADGALGTAHFTPVGDRVLMFNQRGQLLLGRLTPKGFVSTSRTLLLEPTAGHRAGDPVAWSHPAYANGHVVARNDRVLVRASLRAADYDDAQPKRATQTPFHELTHFKKHNAALAMHFSPDGRTLALGTWTGKAERVDLTTRQLIKPPLTALGNHCAAVTWSLDGRWLVYAGGTEFAQSRNNNKPAGKMRLWDTTGKAAPHALTGHTNKITSVVFSPNGRSFATGSADNTVRLWDVATRKTVAVLKGHTDAVWALAFTPDGQTVASASWDGTVKLWDARTGELQHTIAAHDEPVLSVAISPDGRTLATGSADWSIKLWDLPTRQERATLTGHRGAVYALAFAPAGQTLASGSGDETVRLWHAKTGKHIHSLVGQQSGITAIAWSPDGQTLATASRYDGVRLWREVGRDGK